MIGAEVLIWSAVGFVLGAIPFSVLLAGGFGGGDPRHYGDGNPGAFNTWRAAGWQAGAAAILLDFAKGALPVSWAVQRAGIGGLAALPVALAPVAGHAFSPFLRFRGGKALAVTFGIWAGLTGGEAALVLGALFTVFYFTVRPEAWAVMLGMIGLLVYLLIQGPGLELPSIWIGNATLLAWKHRSGLRRPPTRRSRPTGRSEAPPP